MMKYFGKYRGKVVNNVDPLLAGRIQDSVPSVLGSGQSSWAMPCAPYAGQGVGFVAIPATQANVWVEFEGGNPDFPIWSGCFWGSGEFPSESPVPSVMLFKTPAGTLTFSDLPGAGVTLETKTGKIAMTPMGVEITFGGWSVKLSSASVAINGNALEVT